MTPFVELLAQSSIGVVSIGDLFEKVFFAQRGSFSSTNSDHTWTTRIWTMMH